MTSTSSLISIIYYQYVIRRHYVYWMLHFKVKERNFYNSSSKYPIGVTTFTRDVDSNLCNSFSKLIQIRYFQNTSNASFKRLVSVAPCAGGIHGE